MTQIALIGFGEAARAFASTWEPDILAKTKGFDLKSLNETSDISEQFAKYSVVETRNANEAIDGADIIFSLVTADQTKAAAESASGLKPGALFLDCNSVSPATKQENAKRIEEFGGHYVDVAVMAPVHPAKNKVPLLASGAKAEQAAKILLELGMNPEVFSAKIGEASSVKMIRSIMVKGMEALTTECVLAGLRAGVDERVLATLEKSFPEFGWAKKAGYNMERMTQHGLRRAAEMEEVAKTIAELDLPNDMATATIKWHQRVGELGLKTDEADYRVGGMSLVDALKSKES